MDLLVKNNLLVAGLQSFKCSVGTNGLTHNKVEGDLCTPIGNYKFKEIFYRADKLGKNDFLLPSSIITENDGWCDDPKSKFYNQHIRFPFKESAESLYRKDDLYDILFVIDYNINPILSGKGSAIFLHVSHPEFKSTHGCIAIEKTDIMKLAKIIDKRSRIKIEG